jgi:hypothetical protein
VVDICSRLFYQPVDSLWRSSWRVQKWQRMNEKGSHHKISRLGNKEIIIFSIFYLSLSSFLIHSGRPSQGVIVELLIRECAHPDKFVMSHGLFYLGFVPMN